MGKWIAAQLNVRVIHYPVPRVTLVRMMVMVVIVLAKAIVIIMMVMVRTVGTMMVME